MTKTANHPITTAQVGGQGGLAPSPQAVSPRRGAIEAQVSQGGYGTASEYIRELVRADQKRSVQQRLESLLLEGLESLESGQCTEVTPEWWESKKAKLLETLERRKDS